MMMLVTSEKSEGEIMGIFETGENKPCLKSAESQYNQSDENQVD